ncbi:hypothetical protein PARPLA_03304 [Rhodobacteraceae bacterium THAF1]|uniref:DnaA N-terminal domain-containing protein n=1 Tax=Palleronia sp. THAF1 TaxID=2587842 RepID=UPI000F3D27EA|nr:DnaA N-terminal domain-containing protein [Palleronia sp. THAF1]QFU10316.1 hypothetical protein FIU81_16665 [Palleronia sp. THAF1]VDC31427.1 hypothetical protein PARPLA_03304 [Rhodobacteraceae bacterium THAF1]
MNSGRAGLLSQTRPIAGPGAAAIKYDILTALLAMASCGDPVSSRLALRLSLLITARFNWRQGTFSVGQRELARMWGVTERTAKREIAELKRREWIALHVPAARGRVAQYRIQMDRLLRATAPHWEAVGPDFVARMSDAPEPPAQSGATVIPLHPKSEAPVVNDAWSRASARLLAQDPALHAAWFAGLTALDTESGILTLRAQSRFVAGYVQTHHADRLRAALAVQDQTIREIRVVAD